MKNKENDLDLSYWERFYSSPEGQFINKIPSQFSTFILGEFPNRKLFFDIGCGDGRDSFFFATHGKSVYAVDGSKVAIDKNNSQARALGLNNLIFKNCNLLSNDDFLSQLQLGPYSLNDVVVYSRFFLHAINEVVEDEFLKFSKIITDGGGVVCIEYRTSADELRQKETPPHYRRYIDAAKLKDKITNRGMTLAYSIEGSGYAKYKNDDAHIARQIIIKNES